MVLMLSLAPICIAQDWQLVWSDEFDGVALDTHKWRAENAFIPKNNELQFYASDDVYVGGGVLTLRSQRRQMGQQQYTSGLVESRRRFAQTYGRVEVRARLPFGQGIWPAHWMLPEAGQWPPEIDIMELLGHEPDRVYMTLHWGTWPDHWWQGGSHSGPNYSAGFHTFSVDWSPGRIEWQIDGVPRFWMTNHIPQEPFYIILNTAVGGDWPGNPDHTTQFPQHHEIDYVRVFARADPGAALLDITDRTIDGATTDGEILAGEYFASLAGINAGWGDLIGRESVLHVDSDIDGRLSLGIDGNTPWPQLSRLGAVVYLDTEPGGFTSTLPLTDNGSGSDPGRALASGVGLTVAVGSSLHFADGFTADFALVLQDGIGVLYRLGVPHHEFVSGALLDAPSDLFGGDAFAYRRAVADPTMREVSLRVQDLGLAPGDEIRMVATLADADDGHRANEFAGVAPGGWWDAQPTLTSAVQLRPGEFVRLLSAPQYCTADANRDGVVNSQDFVAFLNLFVAADPAADLNADGVINSLDFVDFLLVFTAGC
jgi:hypothetical protein